MFRNQDTELERIIATFVASKPLNLTE